MANEEKLFEAQRIAREVAEVLFPASSANYEVHIKAAKEMQREAFVKGFMVAWRKAMDKNYQFKLSDINHV